MDPQVAIDILQEAFRIGLALSLPVMVAALVVGVAVSVVQSITSIQEQTMVFVPKMVAVLVSLLVGLSWMVNSVMNYTVMLIERIPDLVR